MPSDHETAAREQRIEALAKAVYRSEHVNLAMRDPLDIDCHDVAWAVVDSDWLRDLLAEAEADAWDEGREAAFSGLLLPLDERGMRAVVPNPYRETSKEQADD